MSGALIQAGNPSQKTSLSQAALEVALDRSGTSPKIGLRDLPVEVLQHIIRGVVASDSAGDAAGGARAIRLSNRFLNESVLGEKSVKEHSLFLKQLIPHFDALRSRIPIHEMNSHMLALMGPKQRQGQITAVLGLPDTWNKAKAIANLGAGLASLERPQQLALVTWPARWARPRRSPGWSMAIKIRGFVAIYRNDWRWLNLASQSTSLGAGFGESLMCFLDLRSSSVHFRCARPRWLRCERVARVFTNDVCSGLTSN